MRSRWPGLRRRRRRCEGARGIAQAPCGARVQRVYERWRLGGRGLLLGRVVSIYIEDKFVDPAGPYVLSEELHAIGRMNGLGACNV